MDSNDPQASEEAKSDARGKKTFVLGVVDTSGMKSAGTNRKRRWDQPPEEEDEAAPPVKVAITEDPVEEVQFDAVEPAEEVLLGAEDSAVGVKQTEHVESSAGASEGNSLEVELPSEVAVVAPEAEPARPNLEELPPAANDAPDVPDVRTEDFPSQDAEDKSEVPAKAESPKPPKVESSLVEEPPATNKKPGLNDARKKVEDKRDVPIMAVPVKVSDSLKAILCYDEDSNSSEDSYQDASSVMHEQEKKADVLPKPAEEKIESVRSPMPAPAEEIVAAAVSVEVISPPDAPVEAEKKINVPVEITEEVTEKEAKSDHAQILQEEPTSEAVVQIKDGGLPAQEAILDPDQQVPEDSIPASEPESYAGKDLQYEADNSESIPNPTDESVEKHSGVPATDGHFRRSNMVSMDNSQNCTGFDDLGEKGSSKSPDLDLRYSDSEGDVEKHPEETMHFASLRHDNEKSVEEAKDESAAAIDALLLENPEIDESSLEFNQQSHSNTMEMLDSLVRRSSMESSSQRMGEDLFSEDSLINEINQLPDKEEEKKGAQGKPVIKSQDEGNTQDEDSKGTLGETALVSKLGTTKSDETSEPSDVKKEQSGFRVSAEEDLSQGPDEESKTVAVSSANIMEVIFGEQETSEYPTINSVETESEKGDVKEDGETASRHAPEDSKLQLKNDEIEMDCAEIVAVDPTEPLSGEDSDHEVEEKQDLDKTKDVAEVEEVQMAKEVEVGMLHGESNLSGGKKRKLLEADEPLEADKVTDVPVEDRPSKKATKEPDVARKVAENPQKPKEVPQEVAVELAIEGVQVKELQVTQSVAKESQKVEEVAQKVLPEPQVAKGKVQKVAKQPVAKKVPQTETKAQKLAEEAAQVAQEAPQIDVITAQKVAEGSQVGVAQKVTKGPHAASEAAQDAAEATQKTVKKVDEADLGPKPAQKITEVALEVAKTPQEIVQAAQKSAQVAQEGTKTPLVTAKVAQKSAKGPQAAKKAAETPKIVQKIVKGSVMPTEEAQDLGKVSQVPAKAAQKSVKVAQEAAKTKAQKLTGGPEVAQDAAKAAKPAQKSGKGLQVADEVASEETKAIQSAKPAQKSAKGLQVADEVAQDAGKRIQPATPAQDSAKSLQVADEVAKEEPKTIQPSTSAQKSAKVLQVASEVAKEEAKTIQPATSAQKSAKVRQVADEVAKEEAKTTEPATSAQKSAKVLQVANEATTEVAITIQSPTKPAQKSAKGLQMGDEVAQGAAKTILPAKPAQKSAKGLQVGDEVAEGAAKTIQPAKPTKKSAKGLQAADEAANEEANTIQSPTKPTQKSAKGLQVGDEVAQDAAKTIQPAKPAQKSAKGLQVGDEVAEGTAKTIQPAKPAKKSAKGLQVADEAANEEAETIQSPTKPAQKSAKGLQVTDEAAVEEAKTIQTPTKPAQKSAKGLQVADEVAKEAAKEPVPVLIIKKQAMSSKKDGDKTETLLTCSPKGENAADSPSRKPQSELHVDTHDSAEHDSPKHSPITLRIYKDNLTVKTDLDSPKRTRSPSSGEFRSELSPHIKSPGVADSLSPQNKPLEFTLKIAKDANTNIPKATMSPKRVASPTSVWKSEVQVPETTVAAPMEEVPARKPTRGRGRGRGRPPGRGRGRGAAAAAAARGMETVHEVKTQQGVLMKQEDSQGVQMNEQLKKIINAETPASTPETGLTKTPPTPVTPALQATPVTPAVQATPVTSATSKTPIAQVTPVPKRRGRPRKSALNPTPVPEEVVVKQEPVELPAPTPVEDAGTESDTPSSGRPKRTCRGRTKPIVVKKRKPRGGGAAGGVPRGASTPLPVPVSEIKQEAATAQPPPETTPDATATPDVTSAAPLVPTPAATPSATPVATPVADTTTTSPSDKSAAPTPTTPARGRGGFKRPTPDRNTLSEKELAEIQKIEARKEKLRLDRIAKYEAKKAKKLAKKLKDEERRKRIAREKAEKAEAAAPQVFEEETRMSAPDSSSRGHTPAPNRLGPPGDGIGDESQNSISTPGDTNKGNKKGRMEISITDLDCLVKEVRVDDLAEYQWQGSELYMIQEQVSLYLGVKSFKRKYPGLKRRTVEAEERTFLEDSGLVPKSMCDLGLTAVSSAEILDIMYHDFPEKYEEFRKHVRDKQAREASFKQKAAIGLQRKDGTKVEPREQALEAVAAWNANLNRERREERRCALDLQTFTVHYPKLERDQKMKKPTPKLGLYPVAVIPGQFCDYYKKYTPNELMYFPVNTVVYGPLKPNERHRESMDGSASDSSSSSSSSSSSGDSSSDSESEGEEPARCTMCNGTKKKNKEGLPEVLLLCAICKTNYHPACKEFTPEMIPHLTKYEWQCTACKKCTKCKDTAIKDRIMSCQLCDRGYHLSCIGLKKMPEGRWHCTVCAYCSSCGSRNPGGSDWQHEFKKGDRGVKIYQRTLCTPCFKLWRKGKYCQLCSKCHVMKPEEDPNMIQCNSCDRWLHKECYGSKYGIQTKLLTASSIQCDLCVERLTQPNMSAPGVNRSLIKV